MTILIEKGNNTDLERYTNQVTDLKIQNHIDKKLFVLKNIGHQEVNIYISPYSFTSLKRKSALKYEKRTSYYENVDVHKSSFA